MDDSTQVGNVRSHVLARILMLVLESLLPCQYHPRPQGLIGLLGICWRALTKPLLWRVPLPAGTSVPRSCI